ncbi:hypothetical protein [Streptomyces sp. NPDC048659]|uniref:hypothetical protein n=1 Tax=Streptomyces sp. NPDC048659 TaxID=3155489 RepID=UPI00342A8C69
MSEIHDRSAKLVNAHVAAQEGLAEASHGTVEKFEEAKDRAEAAQAAYHADLKEQGFPVPGEAS